MAERLSLELELLDKVGGPAKKAAEALRGIETQAQKANKALDRANQKQASDVRRFAALQVSAGREDVARTERAIAATRRLALAQLQAHKMNEKYDAAHKGHGGFLASFKEKLAFRSIGDYAKGAFWGHLAAEGVAKIGEGFIEGAHMAVEVLYDGLKDAFKAIGKEQERIAGYDLTLGKPGSATAREDIERFSKQTAFSASQNTDMMLPLFRAGLKGQDARSTYAAALDLAAGRGKGSDQGAVNEAVEFFAKIQQKGGISTKQLAGVGLGETNIPAFYKDLGKYLHISAKEAEKRASEPGGVDPGILRDRIFAAIEKQQGGKLGTGGEMAGSSLFGMWNKLKELPEDFFEKLVNSPAIGKLSKTVGGILEKLDPEGPTGKRIVASLGDMFEKIAGWVSTTLTPENIDKFLVALAKVPDYLNTALKIGEALVAIFVGGKIVGAIEAVVSGVALVSAPVVAIGAAVTAVAIAFKRISKAIDDLGGIAAVKRDLGEFFSTGGLMNAPAVSKGGVDAGYGDIEAQNERRRERERKRAGITNNVGGANVTIVAAPGEDPTHTHQRAAENVTKFMVVGLERAQAEGG